MPHLHRFYIDPDTPVGDSIALTGDEAIHAARVVRLQPGDTVALFDGQGRELLCKVHECSKRSVVLRVVEERRADPSPDQLTLAVAWLHQNTLIETLVKRATEIGVDRFIFYRAQRSQSLPKFQNKWLRISIESCKQSGRLWRPTFELSDGLEHCLDTMSGTILAAVQSDDAVPLRLACTRGHVGFVVGPEGDFSDQERAILLERSVIPISLGPYVYRSEVAALAGAILIRYEQGHLGPL